MHVDHHASLFLKQKSILDGDSSHHTCIVSLQLCTRGRIHIFKFLEIEAIKEDRKRGILEGDCRRLPRKSSTLPDARFLSNDPRRKRLTLDNSNGYPTAADGSERRWSRDISHADHHTNGNAPNAPTPEPAPDNSHHSSKDENDEDDGQDEKGNEERRRAARKILEQQMVTQEERMPTHAQTYREYKEALRQQRGNVYKCRENSHTPSPDTPPLSTYPSLDLNRHYQQKDSTNVDLDRSLLNLNMNADEKLDVKSSQKEAVFSYDKAKAKAKPSPSLALPPPPPYRPPSADHPISPTSLYRAMTADLGIVQCQTIILLHSKCSSDQIFLPRSFQLT